MKTIILISSFIICSQSAILGNIQANSKDKRYEITGSSLSASDPILSLSRRDVVDRKRKNCEKCRSNPLCKNRGLCSQCNFVCKGIEFNQTEETSPATLPSAENIQTTVFPVITPEPVHIETNEIPQDTVVTSRFKEEEANNRYYSIGAFGPGPAMDLLSRLLNITRKDTFDEFIVLAKSKLRQPNVGAPLIVDTAKVFREDGAPVTPYIHRIDGFTVGYPYTLQEIDKLMDETMRQRNTTQLSMAEMNQIINETLYKATGNNTVRCSLDEPEPIRILPFNPETYRNRPEMNRNRPEVKPMPEKPVNPPVIEDALVEQHFPKGKPFTNLLERMESTESSPETLTISAERKPSPQSDNQVKDAKKIYSSEENGDSSGSSISNSSLEDLNNNLKPNAKINRKGDNLEDRIFSVVKDHLKQNSDSEIKRVENTLKEVDDIIKRIEKPKKIEENKEISAANRQNMLKKVNLFNRNLPVSPLSGDIVENGDQKEITSKAQDMSYAEARNLMNNPEKIQEHIQVETIPAKTNFPQDLPVPSHETALKATESRKRVNPEENLTQDKIHVDSLPQAVIEGRASDLQSENQEVIPKLSIKNDADGAVMKLGVRKEQENLNITENTIPPLIKNDENPKEIQQNDEMMQNHEGSNTIRTKISALGTLTPDRPSMESHVKTYFFHSNSFNLPVEVNPQIDGSFKLFLDLNKICQCRSKSCPRKHSVRENLEETAPEIQVRFNDNPEKGISKRSYDLTSGEVMQINHSYKFGKLEGELEEKLQELNNDVNEYYKENEDLVNKGIVALFKTAKIDKAIKEKVNLVNSVLEKMKNMSRY